MHKKLKEKGGTSSSLTTVPKEKESGSLTHTKKSSKNKKTASLLVSISTILCWPMV